MPALLTAIVDVRQGTEDGLQLRRASESSVVQDLADDNRWHSPVNVYVFNGCPVGEDSDPICDDEMRSTSLIYPRLGKWCRVQIRARAVTVGASTLRD
jgi:hypothetical protein